MRQVHGNPRMRVLHASPDAPPLDLRVAGEGTVLTVAYGQVSDYLPLSPGGHRVRAFPTGAPGPGGELFVTVLPELEPGRDYTLLLLGRLASLHPSLILDSTPPPGPDRARVRILHASADAPPLDVGIADDPLWRPNVSFGQVTQWAEVPAGTVDVVLRRAGSDQVLATLSYYTLNPGRLYTFAVLGLVAGTPGFMVMPLVEEVEMRLPA